MRQLLLFAKSTEILYFYQLFLPKAWLRTEDFLKEKKPCQQNLFLISKIRFPTQFNNLKILLPI